jgi:hypothetical protein
MVMLAHNARFLNFLPYKFDRFFGVVGVVAQLETYRAVFSRSSRSTNTTGGRREILTQPLSATYSRQTPPG